MQEKSCGAIVYRKFHGNIELLVVKHAKGEHWSFPKGHTETGETEIETAVREIREETGIDVIVDNTFRETVNYMPKKNFEKQVVYFLAKAQNFDFNPQASEISEIKWIEISRSHDILTYDNDKQIVNRAKKIIQKNSF
ncbi:MAG: NUDIX domain-containing protein [Oscillospiraceae bacterium]|nr:NUDIX domain-containing protein [Oscillospiraceae bacterium]